MEYRTVHCTTRVPEENLYQWYHKSAGATAEIGILKAWTTEKSSVRTSGCPLRQLERTRYLLAVRVVMHIDDMLGGRD